MTEELRQRVKSATSFRDLCMLCMENPTEYGLMLKEDRLRWRKALSWRQRVAAILWRVNVDVRWFLGELVHFERRKKGK